MKKKITLFLSIIIIVILLAVVSFTYAIMSSNISNSNYSIINTNLGKDTFNFTATGVDSFSLNITQEGMDERTAENDNEDTIISDNATFNVSLSSLNNSGLVSCKYDLVWTWTSTDQYTSTTLLPFKKYLGDMVHYNTYIYQFGLVGTTITTNYPEDYEPINSYIDLDDFSSLDWSKTNGVVGNNATVVKDATIYSNNSTPTVSTWYVQLRFKNISADQSEFLGKNFDGRLSVENIRCDKVESEPNTIRMISGNLSTLNSEIAFGDQHFYVIPNDVDVASSYVTLLAKENLYVGYNYIYGTNTYMNQTECENAGFEYSTSEEEFMEAYGASGLCYYYEAEEINSTNPYYGKQKPFNPVGISMKKTSSNIYMAVNGFSVELIDNFDSPIYDYSNGILYGAEELPASDIGFSDTYYFSSYTLGSNRTKRYVYDSNSNFYSYIQNYKSYLQNTFNISIYDSKPISFEQLISLGCEPINTSNLVVDDITYYSCQKAPYYITNRRYSTGSAIDNGFDIYMIKNVNSDINEDKLIDSNNYQNDFHYIRPTIIVNKSTLQSKLS